MPLESANSVGLRAGLGASGNRRGVWRAGAEGPKEMAGVWKVEVAASQAGTNLMGDKGCVT